jgi:hypothetical protein
MCDGEWLLACAGYEGVEVLFARCRVLASRVAVANLLLKACNRVSSLRGNVDNRISLEKGVYATKYFN